MFRTSSGGRLLQTVALAGTFMLGAWPSITPLGLPPYFRFDRDWLAFAALMLFVLPSLALQKSWRIPARLNLPGAFALLLLLIFAVQWLAGRTGAIAPIGIIQAGYLVAMLLAAVAADGWRRAGRAQVLGFALGFGLVAGAALNTVAMVAQFFQQEAWFLGWVPRASDATRMEGVIGQSNLAATLCALAIWVLALTETMLAASRPTRWPGVLLRTSALLLMVGLVMTSSRTGMLELVLMTALLWWIGRDRPIALFWRCLPLQYLLVLGVLRACAQFHGHPFAHGLARLVETTDTRGLAWTMAWEIGWTSPLLGVGFREFSHAQLTAAIQAVSPLNLDHAHNLFLNIWAETGIAGLVALAGLLAVSMRRVWHDRLLPDVRASTMAMGIVAILLLHSMTEFPLWWAFYLFVFTMALSLLPGTGVVWSWSASLGLALGISLLMYPIMLDMRQEERIYNLTQSDMPEVREAAWMQAEKSWWFHSAVERADLMRKAPERQRIALDVARSARLLHEFSDPGLLGWHIRALLMAGDAAEAERRAARMRIIFPKPWCAMLWRASHTALFSGEPEFTAWAADPPAGLSCAA